MATRQQKRPREQASLSDVEPESLTQEERARLSRKQIIDWFSERRFNKLKALRDEIAGATVRQQDILRKKIIEHTKIELGEFNKNLSVEQKEEIAENFSKKLFEAARREDFEKFMEDLAIEEREERLFFSFLGSYGGVSWLQRMARFKEESPLKSVFAENPGLEAEFDSVAEEGDIEDVANFLREKIPGIESVLSQEEIENTLMAFTSVEEPGEGRLSIWETAGKSIPLIGNYLKAGVNWIKRIGGGVHFNFNRKVAKKFNIKLSNLMKISGLTLAELSERDRIFQKYKHILDDMIKRETNERKLNKLKRHLDYINDVNVITRETRNIHENHSELLVAGVRRHLDESTDLPDEDKLEILAKIDLSTLSVQSLLPMVFHGMDYDRENESNLMWMAQSMTFSRRFMRAWRFSVGGMTGRGSYHSAVARSQFARAYGGVGRAFGRGAPSFGSIMKNYPDMQRFMSQGGPLDELNRRANDLSAAIDGSTVSGRTGRPGTDLVRSMGEHDKLFRDYQRMSQRMSTMMTNEAQTLVGIGNELDSLGVMRSPANAQLRLNGRQAQFLGLGTRGTTRAAQEIKNRYLERLVEMNNIQEAAQSKFRAAGNNLLENVSGKLDTKWGSKFRGERAHKEVMKELGEQRRILLHGRKAHYARRLMLPAIALSVPLIDVARGKAKLRDVKYDVFDIGIAFVPIAGTVNDFTRAWRGRTTSGRKLGTRERIMAACFGALGAVSDVAWLFGGVGGVMRGGIGTLRAGKNTARAARSGAGLIGVKRAGLSQTVFRKTFGFFTGANRAERKYRALSEKHNVVALMKEKTNLTNSLKAVKKGSRKYNQILAKQRSVDSSLTAVLGAKARYTATADRYARTGQAMATAAKYAGYGSLGLAGVYVLTGRDPRKPIYEVGKFAGKTAYKGVAKTAELAVGAFEAKTPMEELIERYVKDRQYEKRFAAIISELESVDNKDPEKKKKIEEKCAQFWGASRHVRAWVHKHKDKLDLDRILRLVRERTNQGREMVGDFVEEGGGSRPGGMDVMAGDGGSRSLEYV